MCGDSMNKKQKNILLGTLEHFELQAGFPISVNKEHANVISKYLSGYLTVSKGKSEYKDRPFCVEKIKNKKLPPEMEIFLYKELYKEYHLAYHGSQEAIYKLACDSGVI